MPVSPADFALWARATGNKYPETAEEKFAAAPHAYEYAKNLGRTGQNAPGSRVGGNILYSHPESVQNPSPNSLFDAPVTPDNDAPKVRGTVDRTLTSEHFVNQQEQGAGETSRARQIVDVVGKTALAAGTLAAGVALARNPGVQQAARSAGTAVKENAQNIGSRVSSFLGGFGGQEQANSAVVRNSGDVTPPTTGQQYHQQEIPGLTQFVQTNKTAQANPATQSEVISTSQTFSPNNQSEQLDLFAQPKEREYAPGDSSGSYALNEYERRHPPSAELVAARRQAATADLITKQNARASASTSIQPSIPGVNPTLYALRAQGNVDPSTGEILDATARGWQKTPSYEGTQLDIPFGTAAQPSAGERAADFLAQTTGQSSVAPVSEQTSDLIPNASQSAPSAGERTEAFIGSLLEPNQTAGRKYNYTVGEPMANEGFFSTVTYGGPKSAFSQQPALTEFVSSPDTSPPGRFITVPRETPGKNVLTRHPPGTSESGYAPSSEVTKFVPWNMNPSDEAVPNRALVPSRLLYAATPGGVASQTFGAKSPVRLAGARDVEAAIATQQAQGVAPLGPFSSTLTQQEYTSPWQPGVTASSIVSGIDPGLMTAGTTRELSSQASSSASALPSQEELQAAKQRIQSLGTAGGRTHTFLNQMTKLYDVTGDPNVILSAANLSSPLTVTLPGGETAATRTFYKPFGAVQSKPGHAEPKAFMGEEGIGLTQMQNLNATLMEQSQRLNAAKAEGYLALGIDPNKVGFSESGTMYEGAPRHTGLADLTEDQFNALPPATQTRITDAYSNYLNTQDRLNIAKDFQLRHAFNKDVLTGVNWAPVVGSEETNEVIGMRPVPEPRAVDLLERYGYVKNKGVSRGDVGGVGRRSDELRAQGYDVASAGNSRLSSGESLGDPHTVLYKWRNPETNQIEFLHPEDSLVNTMSILSGEVRPVTGETPTAQRLMGSWDRPYRGLDPSVINTASFDPVAREGLLASRPDLRTPEGLVYAPGAMVSQGGGINTLKHPSFFVAKAQEAGRTVPGFVSEVLNDPSVHHPSVVRHAQKAAAFEKSRGSLEKRARNVAQVSASEQTLRQVGLGGLNPEIAYKEKTTRPETRGASVNEKLFALAHMHAAAWGGMPESQTVPLEEHDSPPYLMTVRPTGQAQPSQNMYRAGAGRQLAIPGVGFGQTAEPDKMRSAEKQSQLNKLLARYTGRSLQGALEGAMYTQPNLF
jgi:hypothetical protein